MSYETADGKTIRFQANWSEGDPPTIGSAVPVHYAPEWSGQARISILASLFGGTLIIGIIGGLFAFGGIL
ncbi:MAG: DUF3592 domain-containing protein, partial [Pseudomonadota bacterium]